MSRAKIINEFKYKDNYALDNLLKCSRKKKYMLEKHTDACVCCHCGIRKSAEIQVTYLVNKEKECILHKPYVCGAKEQGQKIVNIK